MGDLIPQFFRVNPCLSEQVINAGVIVNIHYVEPPFKWLCPLSDYILTYRVINCNRQNAQKIGFLKNIFCSLFLLTKMAAVWYN